MWSKTSGFVVTLSFFISILPADKDKVSHAKRCIREEHQSIFQAKHISYSPNRIMAPANIKINIFNVGC